MIDLHPKHFETVQHILAKHVPGCEVRAFGSRVKWTAKDYSDLDLAVVGSKPLTLRQGYQLAEAFEESDLPIRVDVLDWHTISEEFKRIIAAEYEVIQVAETVKANEDSVTTLKNSSRKNKRWNLVKLGDVVTINPQRKLTKTKEAFHVAMRDIEVFTREITSHSFKEFRGSGARFQNGDTLLARITPCLENGKTVYVDCLKPNQIGHGSTEFIVLSGIEDKTDNLFVYYLARDPSLRTFAIHSMQGSTGRQRVMADSLRSFELTLPPIEGQRRIAHILGTLDDKIKLNQQMNETLEATARAIFKSWFVDFDPVKAKKEGRKPPFMDTETAALFPSVLQNSPLGKVPEGWKVVPLPEVMEVNPRRVLKKGSIAPYLPMQNLPIQEHRPYEWMDREFSSGTKFMNGDTLLAKITPCLENGKTGFVDFLDKGQVGWGSTEYIVLRPKPPLPVEFGYYLARSDDLRVFAIHNMMGSTGRQRVPASCFDYYQISVPTPPIAQRFGEIVKPFMKKIKENNEQSHTLAQTRDTLLPKLLSGEICVEDASEMLEET
ncbi:MAG: restriction endonuclease subunit S [Candidatus Poribacteria bacterium]|nr:restriction endonuclease subunit S [Candidatus Poribacteria bacterium]